MEKLRQYLKEKRQTQKEFSKRSGVSESGLCRILQGKMPNVEEAVFIQRATRGRVKPADWIKERQNEQ